MKLPPIAIFCSSESWGGLEMNTARLALWLHERGHSITLFGLWESPLVLQAKTDRIPYRVTKRNMRYFDLVGAYAVSKELGRLHIRFLILVDNRDLDFGGLVKLVSGNRIRLIYQQHMRLGITKKDPVHTLRFRQLDAWITLLPYMKEEILSKTRFPKERIHLIPLGLDVEILRSRLPSKEQAREELNLPSDGTIIGILGRLDPQKGQHLLIEALHKLNRKGEKYSLLIMGETTLHEGEDYRKKLQDLVSTLGLESLIFFRGYQKDVASFFAAIDLFVLGSYEETYGMVTIEAMLCGTPVVGSNAGGTAELLGNGSYGWLYQPKDPVDMAATIYRALGDPPKLKQVAIQAQLYAVSAFSHTDECIKIEVVLHSLA